MSPFFCCVPEPPMIFLACSHCQKSLSFQDDLAGKMAPCPDCGQGIEVPALAAVTSTGIMQAPATDVGRAPHADGSSPDAALAEANRTQGSSSPDATLDQTQAGKGKDASLTDFLAPAQSTEELGRLGTYRVLGILGTGGMGIVYRAEDTLLGRQVALKVIRPGLAGGAVRERFLREARLAAAVQHDHVVAVFQVGEDRNVPFIAMPLLEGESLEARLERKEKLPLAEVLRIGREIAAGLAAAHRKGLVHRDIKPANVWLEGEGGRVKLLDFGLARPAAQEANITQQGVVLGTPAYMSPEQARGQTADARSDLFSLGCVLYKLCCGRKPFQGRDALSTLLAVTSEQPPPPRQLNAEVPEDLSSLVMQLLEKDADFRPATANDLVQALQTMEKKLAREQEEAEKKAATPDPVAAGVSRSRRPVLLAGILLAIGLIGLGLWFSGILVRFPTENRALVVESDDTAKKETTRKEAPGKVAPGTSGGFVLEFNGTSDYVVVPSLTYRKDHPLTLEAWVQMRRPADDIKQYLLTYPQHCGFNITTVRFPTIDSPVPPHTWSFSLSINPSHSIIALAKDPIPIDRLVHLAGVFDGSKEIRFFLNGKLQGRSSVSITTWTTGLRPFTLGAYPEPDSTFYHFFQGRMRTVRVSETARYERDFKPEERWRPDKDTVALYNFDEGTGETLTDSSGNGHHGKIFGAKWVRREEGFRSLSIPPLDQEWVKKVQALPADKQVEAFIAKMKELNPGFDGKLLSKNEENIIKELHFNANRVTNLAPLQIFNSLYWLDCFGTRYADIPGKGQLTDLSPLQEMNLDSLRTLTLPYTRVNDASLLPLRNCKNLGFVSLSNTEISGAGLIHLRNNKDLYSLSLSNTRIGDAGLAHIKDFRKLWDLRLNGTKISDAGLVHLAELTNLRTLDLSETEVSDQAIAELQKALPGCKIRR